MDAAVTAWTSAQTMEEVLALCSASEVPCGPLYSIDEIFQDPQYAARGNIAFVHEPRIPGNPELAFPNVVPRLTGTPGRIDTLGPALGAHSEQILQDWIGLSTAAIAALRQSGVI